MATSPWANIVQYKWQNENIRSGFSYLRKKICLKQRNLYVWNVKRQGLKILPFRVNLANQTVSLILAFLINWNRYQAATKTYRYTSWYYIFPCKLPQQLLVSWNQYELLKMGWLDKNATSLLARWHICLSMQDSYKI